MSEPASLRVVEAEMAGAFEEFFVAEHERLFQALYLLTGDRYEADDLAQEALLTPRGDGLDAVESRDEAVQLPRRVTPREREAIVLTAYLGYSTDEAGKLLGIRHRRDGLAPEQILGQDRDRLGLRSAANTTVSCRMTSGST